MSAAPRTPSPPDPAETTRVGPERADAGDLVDAVASGLEWAGQRAHRLELLRVELRRCRLTGADIGESSLTDVLFDDCRLDTTGLRHATLDRVVFRDCRMTECDLAGAVLRDVLFERCALQEASLGLARLERVELRGCDLTGARGAEALRGVRMPWPDVVANAALLAAALGVVVTD